MKNKESDSQSRLELQLYRLLGVEQFRKAILLFERVRHRKDKRRNENYHPSGFDVFALERYNGFLLYNAFLHMLSLFFVFVYAAFTAIAGFHNVILDCLMLILAIFNIYCILLQRASYLKLRELRCRYYKRIIKRIDFCVEDSKETLRRIYALEPGKFRDDYELLLRLRKAFEGEADCVLTRSDAESLKRIRSCFEPVPKNKVGKKFMEASDAELIEKCNSVSGSYTMLQKFVDSLQRILRVHQRKMLDCTAIITEDVECEALYRELFPEDTAYNFCLVYYLVYEVYTGLIGEAATDEE